AAYDGAAVLMGVFVYRIDQSGAVTAGTVEAMCSFPNRPAIVPSVLDLVDLFPGGGTHIARPQVARFLVLRKSPRVAQTQGIHFGSTASVGKRVVRRDRVRVAGIDIDP